jgi:hypothetical protein
LQFERAIKGQPDADESSPNIIGLVLDVEARQQLLDNISSLDAASVLQYSLSQLTQKDDSTFWFGDVDQ